MFWVEFLGISRENRIIQNLSIQYRNDFRSSMNNATISVSNNSIITAQQAAAINKQVQIMGDKAFQTNGHSGKVSPRIITTAAIVHTVDSKELTPRCLQEVDGSFG